MTPPIGILVGSKSDMPVLERCTQRLEELGVGYELSYWNVANWRRKAE